MKTAAESIGAKPRRKVKSTVRGATLPVPPPLADKAATRRAAGKGVKRDLDPAIVSAMFADYQRLRSVAKVAALYGRTRQSVWDTLRRRGLTLPRRKQTELIRFDGRHFTRDPHGYWRATRRRSGGEVMLHRAMWEAAHGPIPPGHDAGFIKGRGEWAATPERDRLTVRSERDVFMHAGLDYREPWERE